MYSFKFTKKLNHGAIPQGYVVQVASNNPSMPTSSDLEAALKKAGFNDHSIQKHLDLQVDLWDVTRL